MSNEKRLHVSGDHIGIGIAFLSALFIIYLTFPYFAIWLLPNVPRDLLWRSPLTAVQGLSVFAGLIAIGFALAFANTVNRIKNAGELQIPLWLIVTVFTIVSVFISVLVMVVAFSLTFEALTSIGVGSAVALAVAFLAALLATYILR